MRKGPFCHSFPIACLPIPIWWQDFHVASMLPPFDLALMDD